MHGWKDQSSYRPFGVVLMMYQADIDVIQSHALMLDNQIYLFHSQSNQDEALGALPLLLEQCVEPFTLDGIALRISETGAVAGSPPAKLLIN